MSGLREEITKRLLRMRPHHAAQTPASEAETVVPSDPREGRQFGVYRILRSLGAGGMGHVYLALDTRLGRHVALKFLPHELFADQEMVERLEYEARTASALNHPNILTIYEIGEQEGDLFLASEFVEGITLRLALERRVMDAGMALRVATQIASALRAAHAAGVVHRDLKPANIMIRPDGYIKIIDFGLAKVTADSRLNGIKGSGWTMPGSVMGTIDYMSPEQARGEEVDARSDLWSLGVVLYEMLSGRRPFEGETDSHVIVAILDRPAPSLPNGSGLPRGVGPIVQRALMKNPSRRYQSAQEMLADLERIDAPSTHRTAVFLPPHSRRRSITWISVVAAIVLAAAAIWWWPFHGKDRFLEPDWFQVDSVRQLTFNGHTLESAISPDGKYVAFTVSDPGGMQSLHVKQVDQPSEEVRIPSRAVEYIGLAFSPDSRTIYEVERESGSKLGRLFIVPLVGERSTNPLVEDIDGPVTFSPSDDRFAFIRYIPPAAGNSRGMSTIQIRDASGQVKVLVTAHDALFNQLAWSPSGDAIAGIIDDRSKTSEKLALALYSMNGSRTRRLLPWNYASQFAWVGSEQNLVISAALSDEAISNLQLREYSLPEGRWNDVSKDLAGYTEISMSANGKRLLAIKHDSRAYLWISDSRNFLHGSIVPAESQDTASSLDWLDEARILYTSRRTGYANLAALNLRNRVVTNLTDEPFIEQQATTVPGTSLIVYSSNRSGGTHLWSFDTHSNRYAQLTFGTSYDEQPDASPDGKWIYYTARFGRTPYIRKVRVTGGPSFPVTNYVAAEPRISPDGKHIACMLQKDLQHWVITVLPIDGRGQMLEVPGATRPFRWDPAGNALVSARVESNGASNLWRIELNGKASERLTDFEGESIIAFAWSPSGERLACLRAALGSDVVLITRK